MWYSGCGIAVVTHRLCYRTGQLCSLLPSALTFICRSVVSRKENVAPAALQAALSWWALDALRICFASGANRACLADAGALQALAAVLKAVLSRLHSMTAVLGRFS